MNNRAALLSSRQSATFRTARPSPIAAQALSLSLAVAMLAVAGCGGLSPVAPDGARPAVISTLSGQVHENVTWGDPPLANALIAITGADGFKHTGFSDDHGFYTIAAPPGSVAVTASKPGFEAKTAEFVLVTDTVLNFSLTPE